MTPRWRGHCFSFVLSNNPLLSISPDLVGRAFFILTSLRATRRRKCSPKVEFLPWVLPFFLNIHPRFSKTHQFLPLISLMPSPFTRRSVIEWHFPDCDARFRGSRDSRHSDSQPSTASRLAPCQGRRVLWHRQDWPHASAGSCSLLSIISRFSYRLTVRVSRLRYSITAV